MSKQYTTLLTCVPMRAEPSDKSEMVNQMLMGECATVLDEKDKWLVLQLAHDGYTGWVDRKQIAEVKDSNDLPKHVVKEKFTILDNGTIAVCGAHVHKKLNQKDASIRDIAHAFMYSPYLWGGRTFMGIDCSGFTQVVFRAVGKNIPRDAWQQAEQGNVVTFVDEALPGDLAFFDNPEGRITHVGIITGRNDDGRMQIIHASGYVRCDFLDHQGIFNNDTKTYSHNLRVIKRL